MSSFRASILANFPVVESGSVVEFCHVVNFGHVVGFFTASARVDGKKSAAAARTS